MSNSDWEKALYSGRGIYTPMINSEKDFRAMGLGGPRFDIRSDGTGNYRGAQGLAEVGATGLMENNPKTFEMRTGKELNTVPNIGLGETRNDIYRSLREYSEKERRGRDNSYILVASGALNTWVKQLDKDVINKIESNNFIGKSATIKEVQQTFREFPVLKMEFSKIWNERVKNGAITRYHADQLKERYLNAD